MPRALPVAISMGDPSGIGPEVAVRALARVKGIAPYLYGDGRLLSAFARRWRLSLPVIDPGSPLPARGAIVSVTALAPADTKPGEPSEAGARAQAKYLDDALALVQSGDAEALVTAPISKAQVQRVWPGFSGHTGWLAEMTRAPRVVMMLAGPRLRVALVTEHLALAAVPAALSVERILATIRITDAGLRRDFAVPRPRIAVCGLNPHAGEGGAFGDEEARLVRPAIDQAISEGIRASGPFAADGLFHRAAAGSCDAVVALYHDQGLIPLKLLHFHDGVNVTLGLPIVRTSPDHGVAYDLAGRGIADPGSMAAALALAAKLAKGRRRTRR